MNKLHTILVFGAIFAAGLGTVSVNDQAISAFITPVQYESTSQGIMMFGHVEFVVHDSEGNIVQYAQGDNIIVETGGDCIAAQLFKTAAVGKCDTLGNFDFIAIGNVTSPSIAVGDEQLEADDGGTEDGLAAVGTEHSGEMARKQVTANVDVSGTNAVVTLTNSGDAFSFTGTANNGNATIITQSALFNAGGTPNSNGETTVIGGEMLAAQDLSPAVTVGNGDSLTVTWTVTIGTG